MIPEVSRESANKQTVLTENTEFWVFVDLKHLTLLFVTQGTPAGHTRFPVPPQGDPMSRRKCAHTEANGSPLLLTMECTSEMWARLCWREGSWALWLSPSVDQLRCVYEFAPCWFHSGCIWNRYFKYKRLYFLLPLSPACLKVKSFSTEG